MKHTALSSLRRITVIITALLFFSLYASSGNWLYAYYTKITVYPTGSGQIYMSDYNELPEDQIEYADSVESKEVGVIAMNKYVYAKPKPGYMFVGISRDNPIYEGDSLVGYSTSTEYNSIVNFRNPAELSYTSNITDVPDPDDFERYYNYHSDMVKVRGMMPNLPNNSFTALFTRVSLGFGIGQETLGTLSISKMVNEDGDSITINAFPVDERCHFDRWTLNGATVSTVPEYKTIVNGEACYIAHFTCDSAEIYNFPETGGWIPYCNSEKETEVPREIRIYSFYSDSIFATNDTTFSIAPLRSYQRIPRHMPVYLYGESERTFIYNPDTISVITDNMLDRWSGSEAISVSSLDPHLAYYIADMEAEILTRQTGTINAHQTYLEIPDTLFGGNAPDKIFFSRETAQNYAQGIGTVKATDVKGLGRIYTIDGRQVAVPEKKGLYIIDGKKIIIDKGK
ncbi:MAG: hypothetical protein IKR18_10985 [Bacteroidaceae bacterium]|nr:hypothetical protein [Bacteroidaceae bacterium]